MLAQELPKLEQELQLCGKTLFVTENGNDDNDGLNEGNAKATIKSAVASASEGDIVKVFPGTYVEDNPINLPDNVSVEGTELRRCHCNTTK